MSDEINQNVLAANRCCVQRQRELIKMLGRCRQQFLMYETSHRAKGTEEADQKAEVNAGLAKEIEDCILKMQPLEEIPD